mgnify:CR=1 FL=1
MDCTAAGVPCMGEQGAVSVICMILGHLDKMLDFDNCRPNVEEIYDKARTFPKGNSFEQLDIRFVFVKRCYQIAREGGLIDIDGMITLSGLEFKEKYKTHVEYD